VAPSTDQRDSCTMPRRATSRGTSLAAFHVEFARARWRPEVRGGRMSRVSPMNGKQRTESHGGAIGPRGGRVEAIHQPAERNSMHGDGGIQGVAVIDRVNPLAIARTMPRPPRTGGPEPDLNQRHGTVPLTDNRSLAVAPGKLR